MTSINTFVFFDLETTGLPWQEKLTKIIEFSFVAAQKEDILEANASFLPPLQKLSGIVNPKKKISPTCSSITGLTTSIVKKYPIFSAYFLTIENFFKSLPKPICIVAHNGNIFDFKIFQAECCAIGKFLPFDTFCVDSLPAFRHIFKKTPAKPKEQIPTPTTTTHDDNNEDKELIMTSDDAESDDIWSDIDENELCNLENSLSQEQVIPQTPPKPIEIEKPREVPKCYKLGELYSFLTTKEVKTAHRAEADCLMLLECVVAVKNEFIEYAEKNCKLLCNVESVRQKR